MVWHRPAVVVAAVAMMIGLTVTPANAAAARSAFEGMTDTRTCLDYNATDGLYLTGCNWGDYQTWYWDDSIAYTALRNKATGLCLTARNGLVAMRQCLADDAAAYWRVTKNDVSIAQIKNSVTGTCLARNALQRAQLSDCSGGPSQQWRIWTIT